MSIPTKHKEAVRQMESEEYVQAQGKDDFAGRVRHLEGKATHMGY